METADRFLQLSELAQEPGKPSLLHSRLCLRELYSYLLSPLSFCYCDLQVEHSNQNKIKMMMAILLACSLCFPQCPKLFLAYCKHSVNPGWMKAWTSWLHWILSPVLVLTFDLVYSGLTIHPYHKKQEVTCYHCLPLGSYGQRDGRWLPGINLTTQTSNKLLVSHVKSECNTRKKRNPGS